MKAEDFKGHQILLPVAWHRTPAFGAGDPGIIEGNDEVAAHDTIEPMYIIPPGYAIVPQNMAEQVIEESQHKAQVREQRRYEVARNLMCAGFEGLCKQIDRSPIPIDIIQTRNLFLSSMIGMADHFLDALEKQKGSEEPLSESSNDQAG